MSRQFGRSGAGGGFGRIVKVVAKKQRPETENQELGIGNYQSLMKACSPPVHRAQSPTPVLPLNVIRLARKQSASCPIATARRLAQANRPAKPSARIFGQS